MNYITVTYPQTASVLFQGRMYNHLQQVFLSSGNIQLPSITAINAFSTNPLVSASFPAFSGYQLDPSMYYTTDDIHLYVTAPSFSANGTYDIILFNVAGYSKLSQEGILINNILKK